MQDKSIEYYIIDSMTGDSQLVALNFVAYLKANLIQLERGRGYWEDQFYYFATYKNECVCYILIDGKGVEEEFSPLTIWSDDSSSNCLENHILDENMRNIAWDNVDFCRNCGSCVGGVCKTIFGKKFINVCRTSMIFVNPDIELIEVVKKIIEIRKSYILSTGIR